MFCGCSFLGKVRLGVMVLIGDLQTGEQRFVLNCTGKIDVRSLIVAKPCEMPTATA